VVQGRERRQRGTNSFGPAHPRTCAVLMLVLTQFTDSSSVPHRRAALACGGLTVGQALSRFLIADLPGAEKMLEVPEALRAREGPTLNQVGCVPIAVVLCVLTAGAQSVIALNALIRDLASPEVGFRTAACLVRWV
jgi:hypothetical protein